MIKFKTSSLRCSVTASLLLALCVVSLSPSVQAASNISIGKPVTQSSVYNFSVWPPSNAVDGNLTTIVATHSGIDNWIQVDLGASYDIAVTVVTRTDEANSTAFSENIRIEYLDDEDNIIQTSSVFGNAEFEGPDGSGGISYLFWLTIQNVHKVRIMKVDDNFLVLTEITVWGWLTSEPIGQCYG